MAKTTRHHQQRASPLAPDGHGGAAYWGAAMPRRCRSSGVSASAKRRRARPDQLASSSTSMLAAPSSDLIDLSPAATSSLAMARSEDDHLAQRGCGRPPTIGTALAPPGQRARTASAPAVMKGRSHASTSAGPVQPSPVKHSAPAQRATSGPSPRGSSKTEGSPEHPTPTSTRGQATRARTPARRTALRTPPTSRQALSKPIRRLAPPVRSIPLTRTREVPVGEVPVGKPSVPRPRRRVRRGEPSPRLVAPGVSNGRLSSGEMAVPSRDLVAHSK